MPSPFSVLTWSLLCVRKLVGLVGEGTECWLLFLFLEGYWFTWSRVPFLQFFIFLVSMCFNFSVAWWCFLSPAFQNSFLWWLFKFCIHQVYGNVFALSFSSDFFLKSFHLKNLKNAKLEKIVSQVLIYPLYWLMASLFYIAIPIPGIVL